MSLAYSYPQVFYTSTIITLIVGTICAVPLLKIYKPKKYPYVLLSMLFVAFDIIGLMIGYVFCVNNMFVPYVVTIIFFYISSSFSAWAFMAIVGNMVKSRLFKTKHLRVIFLLPAMIEVVVIVVLLINNLDAGIDKLISIEMMITESIECILYGLCGVGMMIYALYKNTLKTKRTWYICVLIAFSMPFVLTTFVFTEPVMYDASWAIYLCSMVLLLVGASKLQITNDSLTGIKNRRAFEKDLEDKVNNSDKYNNLYLSIVDMNDFKVINKVYGRDVADEVIKFVANVLNDTCLKYRFVGYRIDGDEFAIISHKGSKDELKECLEEIGTKLKECPLSVDLSISYGISRYEKNMDISRFMQEADAFINVR